MENRQQKRIDLSSISIKRVVTSYGFYIILVLLFIAYTITAESFLTLSNLMSILHSTSPLMIISCGIAFVIISGQIDISVGSIAYLSASIGTVLITKFGWPIMTGLIALLVVGLLLGSLNGLIVVVLRVSPLIATLGTLIAFRGIALQLTNSQVIGLPDQLRNFGSLSFGPVFLDFLLVLSVLIVFHLIHVKIPYGRNITATGNSNDTALKIGINVPWIKFSVFALSGLLAGLGGFFSMCQVGALSSFLGNGTEFIAITAIIIGGISLLGGEGKIIPGVLLGVILLGTIENGLNLLGASPYSYPFVRGAIIFIAMFADSFKKKYNL